MKRQFPRWTVGVVVLAVTAGCMSRTVVTEGGEKQPANATRTATKSMEGTGAEESNVDSLEAESVPGEETKSTEEMMKELENQIAARLKPDLEGVTPVTLASYKPEYNTLTDFESYVLKDKGTERAFKGEYTDTELDGTYICRRCNMPLYQSTDKFHSGCGWPAFDDEITGSVDRYPDPDGQRVEIVCHNCDGHLGHVFHGERFTETNTRHCVNSVSMRFVPMGKSLPKVIWSKESLESALEAAEEDSPGADTEK